MTVDGVGLHTGVEVYGVLATESVAVACGVAHIPFEHVAVCALVDTAVRQDRDRQSVDVVGVGVEERVAVADC